MEYRYHWKHRNCKRPTYYTMITLFDQNRKYCNQNNKILDLVSLIALQATLLIGTTKPSSSVPRSSDRHALLSTEGNLELILNLDKILVHVMRYCIIKSVYTGTANWHWNWFFFLNFFQMWKHLFLQAKQETNKTSGPEHFLFKKINPSF